MYFDYASTSIKRKNILKDLFNSIEDFDANASSIHSRGKKSKIILEESRRIIAESIGASPEEIYFTSGATESNNMIINNFNNENYEIISTSIEHKSILEPLLYSSSKSILLDSDKSGRISLEELKKNINEKTKLVSIIFTNNESGIIQPIEDIGSLLKGKNIWFHVDAVQTWGHIDIDVKRLNVDSLSISGHKIGSLNGIGAIYIRKKINPLIFGGNQEKGLRSGTVNVMGTYSMAKSILEMKKEREYIQDLKFYFLEKLKKIPYEINGDINFSTNHIVNIYFPFVRSDLLLTYLDLNNIYVSAGSACNSNTLEPSYVIENMYNKYRAKHSIRFSFGYKNTKLEIDYLIDKIYEMYLRKRNND